MLGLFLLLHSPPSTILKLIEFENLKKQNTVRVYNVWRNLHVTSVLITGQYTYNVTLRLIRATIVAPEKQEL
jgi:hypothetical protein